MRNRNNTMSPFAAGTLIVLGAAIGRSEPAPPVEDLVAEALDRAPSVAALAARLDAARAMIAPAGAPPDPMVETMWQNVGFPKNTVGTEEMSMRGVEVRQELLYPGKRAARRDVATAEADVRMRELHVLRRQVAAQVRSTYARIYALDREAQSLASARQLLDILAATAASRYSAGEAEQEAVVKAQLEVSRLDEKLAELRSMRATMVAMLNRLLDRPGGSALGQVEEIPGVTPPPGPWEELALLGSPDIAAKRSAVAAAERRVALAKKELRPNFSAAAALGERVRMDPVVTVKFGVEVPFWKKRKQEPMLRAAEAELEMARHELRDAEAMARSEAARLWAEWQRAQNQIQLYVEAIVPQTSAAIDAARASYLAGRGDFSVVVEDFNMWLDARVELERRRAERYQTWAELSAIADVAPEDTAVGRGLPAPPALSEVEGSEVEGSPAARSDPS